MASDNYAEICDQIYARIMKRLEDSYLNGTRVARFAPIGTAEEVLKPEILYRFFRSLQLPQIRVDTLVQRLDQRKLHKFLAILIFTSCTIATARTFTIKLLAPTDTEWPQSLSILPADRESLESIFGEPVTPDKILSTQACFCPIMICKKKNDHIESLERECLPYLEQELRGKGAFGMVYRVKIAQRHFFSPNLGSANSDPIDVARKDFHNREDTELDVLQQILACKRPSPNIIEIYGSLEIGSVGCSIFMPLAIEDLRAHMKDDTRPRPGATERTDMILAAAGVAEGLEFLHNNMEKPLGGKLVCYHMDLKPDNILIFPERIDENGKLIYIWKISDFGMSHIRHQEDEAESHENVFTRLFLEKRVVESLAGASNMRLEGTYLAPESLLPGKTMKTSSDVWSLGCIISVLFTYLVEGTAGVAKYEEIRSSHRNANGRDRFFVANTTFGHPKINSKIGLYHDLLVKKASQQIPQEGQALRSILTYLERHILLLDQKKRHPAKQLKKELESTHHAYKELDNTPRAHPNDEQHRFSALLQDIRITESMGNQKEASKKADTWFFKPKEAFKDCDISPDGSIIAFWNDFTIWLYTQSCERIVGQDLYPVAEFLLDKNSEPRRFLKSLSLTDKYLIVSLSGNDFQCNVFDLRRDKRRNKSANINLKHYQRVSLHLPEIKEVAISSGGQIMAFIVRDKERDDNPGSLYIGNVGSPNDWKLVSKLRWPASDVIQLSFSPEDDIYIVFRPQRADQAHNYKIPVLHACLAEKNMYPLIIEPRHCWPLYRTRSTLTASWSLCNCHSGKTAAYTKPQRAQQSPPVNQKSISITNYRVIKLISGLNHKVMFAVGRKLGDLRIILLEITINIPMPQADNTDISAADISVKEVAILPNLSYHSEFTARVFLDQGNSYFLLAALLDSNACGIYKVCLDGASSSSPQGDTT
ncbi:uncharacterized protein N7511_003606 [Penicillium nucicola]|uniref:uncharacterized protein n=1 Tax=Penicillium nucicola TaxID=1850975 RepID=UPI002544ED56|nr:uncharacterized protein N7511_003606 [Penicillium nucicola]KAJ5765990.1 hypothetical protein N7511_003606 [Penicillium nucicola]